MFKFHIVCIFRNSCQEKAHDGKTNEKKNSEKTSAGRFLRHKHKQTFALENENCDAM